MRVGVLHVFYLTRTVGGEPGCVVAPVEGPVVGAVGGAVRSSRSTPLRRTGDAQGIKPAIDSGRSIL